MVAKNKKKERCLFIDEGEVIKKILLGQKFWRKYRPMFFDVRRQKRSLTQVVKTFGIKTIVMEGEAVDSFRKEFVQELVNLRLMGVSVYHSDDFYEIINQRIPIVRLQGNKYLTDGLFSAKISKRYLAGKRIFDLCVVFGLAPIALPLIGLGALGTALTSKGGMFFAQERFGEKGKIFKVYKIRTMKVNDASTYTAINDKRITFLGKFLRLTKIDELPQLYNILKGDMSVFGPRPEMLLYARKTLKENPYYALRHIIKPGVSGWAQIHIPKANSDDNLKKLEYDLFYIKNYSPKLDLQILLKTIKIIFTLNSK